MCAPNRCSISPTFNNNLLISVKHDVHTYNTKGRVHIFMRLYSQQSIQVYGKEDSLLQECSSRGSSLVTGGLGGRGVDGEVRVDGGSTAW